MMNIRNEQGDPEWYLKDPRIRRWMVQCAGCRRRGYRSDAPARFHGRSQLEKYIGELKVDAKGLCDNCQAVLSQRKSM
jgi:hypothetical protein